MMLIVADKFKNNTTPVRMTIDHGAMVMVGIAAATPRTGMALAAMPFKHIDWEVFFPYSHDSVNASHAIKPE